MYPAFFLFFDTKLDHARLTRALSRVLQDFPMFAGSYDLGADVIQISHATHGVLFEHELRSESIAELERAARAGQAKWLAPKLSFARVLRRRETLFAVKHTTASNGSALWITWDHILGDMHSAMLFVRAWAAAYSDAAYVPPAQVFDRDVYLKEHMPNIRHARSSVRVIPWSTVARSVYWLGWPRKCINIEYSAQQLENIRNTLSTQRRVSINDAICAHLCVALRRISGLIDPTNLCLSVNYRKRVGIPDNVIGNLVTLIGQPVDEVDEPAEVAARLRTKLEEYNEKHVDYRASLRVFEAQPRSQQTRVASRYFEPGRGDLLITNWNNFGAYELCFDGASPVFYMPVSFGLASPRPWCAIVYELPRKAGLGFSIGLTEALAERIAKSEGQTLLSRDDAPAWAPIRQALV